MMFVLSYMLVMTGLFLAGFMGLMPLNIQLMVPTILRIALFAVGMVLAFFGVFLPHSRAKKTGAEHLIDPGRPGTIIWFYVHRDGTVRITPAIREVENALYAPELDALVHEMKSYRLFDHSVRFVPEGIGHAVDLDMCLYVTLLKNKYGYQNLREARKLGRLEKFKPPKQKLSDEQFVGEDDL
jgi:hypothetical protein